MDATRASRRSDFPLRDTLVSGELLGECLSEVNAEEAHGRSDDSRAHFTSKSLRPASCCAASDPVEHSGKIGRRQRMNSALIAVLLGVVSSLSHN